MQDVFISSVISGFEAIRAAAREGVESAGYRAVMAETAGASPLSSQQALLDLVARSDVYLLLLGKQYGERGASGLSPTEDEFNEAKRRNRQVIALRQNVEMEEAQASFAGRVSGSWEEGVFYARFDDERDVGFKVVRALTNLSSVGNVQEIGPKAQDRAGELAVGTSRQAGYFGSSSRGRVVFVPLVAARLLDELALEAPELPNRLSDAARESNLVPHALGITARVSSEGVSLLAGEARAPEVSILVGTDGVIVVEAAVTGTAGNFGGGYIDPERLDLLLRGSTAFATDALQRIDPRRDVLQTAIAFAVTNANGHIYGRPRGSAMSFGSSHQLPPTIVVPQPATIVRREDMTSSEVRMRLLAAVRRVFADANAVTDG